MEKKRLIESYGVKAFKSHGLDEQGWAMYRAVGCGECGGTGYKGRMAIHEMLPCSSKLREMIYRRASLDEIRKQAVVEGMRTMRQDGIQKIIAGHSDYSQLLQVVGVAVD
jgi:type II secretory ATPase GspE/PulE/Tfp pilus assembly ATPase PilB-like protein